MGFSLINQPFSGTPNLGNPHVETSCGKTDTDLQVLGIRITKTFGAARGHGKQQWHRLLDALSVHTKILQLGE